MNDVEQCSSSHASHDQLGLELVRKLKHYYRQKGGSCELNKNNTA